MQKTLSIFKKHVNPIERLRRGEGGPSKAPPPPLSLSYFGFYSQTLLEILNRAPARERAQGVKISLRVSSFRFIGDFMPELSIPYRQQFTRQTERLIELFMAHTQLSRAAICTPAGGNALYLNQVKEGGKHGVSVGLHDRFLENISALWPDDLYWPEDSPRPPPGKADFDQLSQEARDAVAARIRKNKERANG